MPLAVIRFNRIGDAATEAVARIHCVTLIDALQAHPWFVEKWMDPASGLDRERIRALQPMTESFNYLEKLITDMGYRVTIVDAGVPGTTIAEVLAAQLRLAVEAGMTAKRTRTPVETVAEAVEATPTVPIASMALDLPTQTTALPRPPKGVPIPTLVTPPTKKE